jgi:hypothetical protein
MCAFRVKSNDDITMVSCDTVSSLLAKVASTCRAAVCSIICSYSTKALTLHGPALVTNVRDAPVLHILSPMIRQLREMSERIPKRRKTTQDAIGNISVDQFFFPFDEWSCIVPRTVQMLKILLSELADGTWWEIVLDLATEMQVRVDDKAGDLFLVGHSPLWLQNLPLDVLDRFTATIEMTFHGFGGGSARKAELEQPTMFNCIFSNDSVYYTLGTRKVFGHTSCRFKEVERKLPVIISRFFVLLRLLMQSNREIFEDSDISLLLTSRMKRSDYGVSHVIRDIFSFGTLPDLIQVRQFWAGVSNYVTGGEQHDVYLTSSEMGAEKKGAFGGNSRQKVCQSESWLRRESF